MYDTLLEIIFHLFIESIISGGTQYIESFIAEGLCQWPIICYVANVPYLSQ